MKICRTCKILKPYSEYHIKNRMKDGRTSHCKDCENRKYRQKSRNEGRKERLPKVIKNIPEVKNFISDNYDELISVCKNITGNGYKQFGEDLLPSVIIQLLEKPYEYQIKLYEDGKIIHWIAKVMSLQLKHSNSQFNNEFKKNLRNSDEDIHVYAEYDMEDKDTIITHLLRIISDMGELDRNIMNDLISGKSPLSLQKKYGITQHTMRKMINGYYSTIRNELKSYYD